MLTLVIVFYSHEVYMQYASYNDFVPLVQIYEIKQTTLKLQLCNISMFEVQLKQ